ncbi:MAG TPA: zf-HC2 domain-containing protein [Bryobacteraceae bacterium]|jgi:anti-sigma factor RsiW|nr:zf-HC2 domain-containing protein [Bryobacteraceae bacterium]
MMQCWHAGELRAYLDNELPAGDIEQLAAHLQECVACNELCAELRRRSEWVAARLGALPVQEPVSQMPRAPHRSPAVGRWAGVALALAASLVLAFVLHPRGEEKQVVVSPASQTPSPAAPAAQPPMTVKPAIIRRIVPRKKAAEPKPQPQREYFLALDDDPVEAGVVVRVELDNGRVPADVIVGTDGRAHAIRLVSSVTGER